MGDLVSVVIPAYNRRNFILRAIDSVIGQTYRPIEVIVVDDASTDGTVDFLRSMNFPIDVEVVQLPANRGPSTARNVGVQHAKGVYVAFLDSDDRWLPQKLERQVSCLEGLPNRRKALVYSQVHLERSHETLLRPHRAKRRDESVAEYLFAHGGHLDSSNIFLATELARRIPYNENMRLHEDWDLYLRMEEGGVEFVMIPEVLSKDDDTSRADRGSNPQTSVTLDWLETWRPRISRRAYLALRAKFAPYLRAQAPFLGLRYIVEAYVARAIDTRYLLFLGAALVHPKFRTLISRLRGAIQGKSRLQNAGG
jgi:glycosyltransferase involved in cell wall biosynthesis